MQLCCVYDNYKGNYRNVSISNYSVLAKVKRSPTSVKGEYSNRLGCMLGKEPRKTILGEDAQAAQEVSYVICMMR